MGAIVLLVVLLFVVGVLLSGIFEIDPKIKQLIYIVVVIGVLLCILAAFGVLGDFHFGRLR